MAPTDLLKGTLLAARSVFTELDVRTKVEKRRKALQKIRAEGGATEISPEQVEELRRPSQRRSDLGADAFLPVWFWVVIRANVNDLPARARVMRDFLVDGFGEEVRIAFARGVG